MATPRVAWGIDIGNRALKAVKLVRTATGVKIDDYDVIEHENLLSNAGDNRETLIQTALALFQGKHNLKGLPAAVGVSGQSSFARFIKLPPVEEKQIPQIVKFEAIQQIPFPLDEVEWSYQLFRDEASPDIEVGIFAMRKELVNQHLAYFTASGVNVQVVQMNPLAVYNALAYDDKIKGTTMIIDLGAENADLLIAEGESVWMRSIPIGGNHFTDALVRDFKLRFERAEELKRTTATSPHGRRILQAMRPVFADLVSEIQRSIGFYSSTHRDSRIARVIVLGGTFKLPGLQKYLQQNLGLELHKLDGIGLEPPSDPKIAAALSENALSSASAYGLALQALGDAKITSSLLPAAIQKERMWQEKTKWFAATAAAFVVGSGIAFGTYQMEKSAFNEQESTRGEIDRVLAEATGVAGRFKEVSGRGEADRAKIKEMTSLSESRDVWPKLIAEVDAAVPMPPATRPANAPPRGQRKEVRLEDMEVEYVPAMAQLVEKGPDGRYLLPATSFNERAGKRDPMAMAGLRSRRPGIGAGAAPGVVPGAAAPGGFTRDDAGSPVPFSPGGSSVGPVASGDASAPGQKRGYLLTLHLTTPNVGGTKFIEDTVVKAFLDQESTRTKIYEQAKAQLAAQGLTGPLPHISYSVARVSISSAQQLKYDEARKQALIAKAQAAQARELAQQPQSLDIGGGAGGAGRLDLRGFTPDDGGGVPGVPGVPGLPGGVGLPGLPGGTGSTAQDVAAQQAAANALLVDPVTKESLQDDWELTVLIAVVLDPHAAVPAAPAAEAPADGSSGDQPQ
ncbi:type IV pilus assembly protein PilM [Humisphaera borealis]|uniref:Type IV pilus assembly protein PilM n=1 Tax=Humisphaera borealis TaxID=2807512 RepID=A0A7M2WUR8_9BACT|nr:type IV pilus assembly protein PilM [Humisphaera borealis]QOV89277.1 type IV pilus assembly protein PilM [Humisphaera borealis]